MKKESIKYLLVSFFTIILVCFLYSIKAFERLEAITYDLRVQLLSPNTQSKDNIKLILIDQNSLTWAQESNGIGWPWPREMYSAINAFLKEAGAKVVVYDIIYSEDSFYGISDDETFAQSLKQLPSINGIVVQNIKAQQQEDQQCVRLNKDTNKIIYPVDVIKAGFKYFGISNAIPDGDGIIRKVQLCYEGVEKHFDTLPVKTYKFIQGIDTIDLQDQQKYIHYIHAPFSFQAFSAASIIESFIRLQNGADPIVPLDDLKDSVVFVGVSAPGLYDTKTSPLSSNHPGVDIQATILSNLINNDFIHKANSMFVYILIVLISLIVTFAVYRLKKIWKLGIFLSVCLMLLIALALGMYYYGIWLEIVAVFFSFILSLLLSAALGYLLENKQKQFIKGAFTQYLNPHIVQNLIEDPTQLQLGGKLETLTIFFCDLESFTTISEKLDPEEVVAFLNEYLTEISNIILKHHGTIDKYEGDAIIAFWNAPIKDKNHADNALIATIESQQKLQELHSYFLEKYGINVKMRVGIHTGEVVVGNIGSVTRFDYSFIGDAGNLASRLEGVNKVFKTVTLFSKTTLENTHQSFQCRKVGTVIVMGKKTPVEVFEALINTSLEQDELDTFQKAIELFEEGKYKQAKKCFESLADKDIVSKNYLDIIEKVETHKMVWENGLVLDSK